MEQVLRETKEVGTMGVIRGRGTIVEEKRGEKRRGEKVQGARGNKNWRNAQAETEPGEGSGGIGAV